MAGIYHCEQPFRAESEPVLDRAFRRALRFDAPISHRGTPSVTKYRNWHSRDGVIFVDEERVIVLLASVPRSWSPDHHDIARLKVLPMARDVFEKASVVSERNALSVRNIEDVELVNFAACVSDERWHSP